MDMDSAFGDVRSRINPISGDKDDLDLEALDNWCSIRANTAVFKGCYYYEV